VFKFRVPSDRYDDNYVIFFNKYIKKNHYLFIMPYKGTLEIYNDFIEYYGSMLKEI